MDFKVFIAAHKLYDLPTDRVYEPLHVGAADARVSLPYTRDDSGENISSLNNTYCELTGLYWAWKNTHHDAYGLVHYRRYFSGSAGAPANSTELRTMLTGVDVVVPRRRRYVIQTVAQHYGSAHYSSDLAIIRDVLISRDPSALPAFDRVMRSRSLVLYNMFLMRERQFSEYCNWLFPVLEAARPKIPVAAYGVQQGRVMGYLGERLLNVWLEKQPRLKVRHVHLVEVEPQSRLHKGVRMLGRMAGTGKSK